MVKHDIQAAMARAEQRAQEQPKPPEKEKSPSSGGWSVLAVQSIACVVILLLVLLARVAGGSAYEQLREGYFDGMMSNDLLAALTRLWDGDPLEALSSDPLQEEGESRTAATTTTTTTTATAAGVSDTGGRLPPEGALAVAVRANQPAYLPLSSGRLTSDYGYRENPTGEGEQFHRGVDIAAPAGTPVAAMFYGSVTAVGENESLGRYIRLAHGGMEVLYAHCMQIVASEGMTVRGGETVALVGATGDATGNHVHIQVSVGGVVYDPCGVVPLVLYA